MSERITSTKTKTGPVFAAACIGMCFFGISMITLGSVLPELAERFALSDEERTGLTTSLPGGILLGSLLFGPVVDRYGHKLLLILSCLLVLCGVAGLAWAPSTGWLPVAIVAIGLGGGVLNGETNALVTELYEGQRRASRLSLLGMFYGAGALTIPVLLDQLHSWLSYPMILSGMTLLMVAGVCFCSTVRYPAPKQPQGFPLREVKRIIASPTLLLLSLVLFFQSGVESVTNNWTTTYTAGEGFSESAGLGALTAMLIGLTAARLLQVWLFNRMAPTTVLMISLLLTVCAFESMALATSPVALYVSMAVVGAGLASTFPVIFGILGTMFPTLSGTAFSIALVVALCGQMVLNTVAGSLPPSAMPHLTAAAAGMMILLYVVWQAAGMAKGNAEIRKV
ncbi:MAG: MFS transporter [Muribaculaceae bacterium]|nr:MFS transporter [Muribaculaceae bacterium]